MKSIRDALRSTDATPRACVSLVVPVRNEAPNILPLAREIEAAFSALDEWECIWVDDASSDDTPALLKTLDGSGAPHRVLTFSRHLGQTAALLAGWRAARFDYLASLDGDRQFDPSDIPRLLEKAVRDELDMVNGVRSRRQDSWVRRISSKIAKGFRDAVTGDRVSDVGCSARVLRSEFLGAIPPLRNMHRFLPTLVRMAGGRVAEAPVSHRPRPAGESKYGIWNRLWVGIADTLAIRWMRARYLEPAALDPPASAAADATAGVDGASSGASAR